MNRKNVRLDNRGSALVSVLVVTVFISILATTMLYVSAQNYQMKYTDYQNKQSFYGAEKALDSLKALLVKDVQDAYEEAYKEVSKNFLIKSADQRKECYQQAYLDELEKIWQKRFTDAGSDPVKMIQDFMTAQGVDVDTAKRIYSVGGYAVVTTASSGTATGKQFVINGVRAKFTSGNYTTFLYTDIGLALPALDVSDSGSTVGQGLIDLTDCVVYMNWRRADYEE